MCLLLLLMLLLPVGDNGSLLHSSSSQWLAESLTGIMVIIVDVVYSQCSATQNIIGATVVSNAVDLRASWANGTCIQVCFRQEGGDKSE